MAIAETNFANAVLAVTLSKYYYIAAHRSTTNVKPTQMHLKFAKLLS